ncbi:hypothetical protein CK203_114005 [Vitis vinifera]|uniref:Uncharacterized protein n=1 Tax=Vitis vinifera TaxID=29760 RepID=A0A438CA83_VITVI|nr:hypothetical protein CK203_114005 [Vitis vinifera]
MVPSSEQKELDESMAALVQFKLFGNGDGEGSPLWMSKVVDALSYL